MKSLTEGLDLSEKKSSKESDSESGSNLKSVIIIVVCLIGAGVGMAWNFGLFEPAKVAYKGKTVDPGGQTLTADQQKDIDRRQKMLELPPGTPGRPTAGSN